MTVEACEASKALLSTYHIISISLWPKALAQLAFCCLKKNYTCINCSSSTHRVCHSHSADKYSSPPHTKCMDARSSSKKYDTFPFRFYIMKLFKSVHLLAWLLLGNCEYLTGWQLKHLLQKGIRKRCRGANIWKRSTLQETIPHRFWSSFIVAIHDSGSDEFTGTNDVANDCLACWRQEACVLTCRSGSSSCCRWASSAATTSLWQGRRQASVKAEDNMQIVCTCKKWDDRWCQTRVDLIVVVCAHVGFKNFLKRGNITKQ